ncbi:helix-turn-helix transcriptional regulator [Brevundimonas sp.]|uniref:helix-turn-helix domain-containing protein n=1 Tax=Brevundimonas sp. TaxID=1871086 RepID=UPI0025C3B47C|nr:helix-turn-helix transcriptional regulator [Brevundimonas sp.]
MSLAQIFGRNVRRIRMSRGVTLEALAHDVGLAYSYVGQIERGGRNPTLDVVERLATALKVSSIELLSEPGDTVA